MPKVSIIIPVYNAEKYLARCLESILNQDFTDYEVVLVDDGSTDGSCAICERYAAKYPWIVFLHKENGGVSSARNLGLEFAKGEWLSFVDADDTLPHNALSSLIAITQEKVSLSMGTYVVHHENGTDEKEKKEFFVQLNKTESINILFQTSKYGYQGYLWNKLFRADIVREAGLQFNEKFRFNEDRLFCVRYICVMKGITAFTSTPVYHYNKHCESVMGTANRIFNHHIFDDYESSILILEIIKQYHFPRKTINLAQDRIIDSYDLIRHNMRATGYEAATEETAKLKQRAIHDAGGLSYFIVNRIRRFFSKQIRHLLKNK